MLNLLLASLIHHFDWKLFPDRMAPEGVTPQTPKGLKHEKDISKYLKFFLSFLFDNPIHKIISSSNIMNYHNNSIEYTLRVSQSSK